MSFRRFHRLLAGAAVAAAVTASVLASPVVATAATTNQAPHAGNIQISGQQDTSFYLRLSGIDPEHQGVKFSIVNKPSHGSLSSLYSGLVTWTYNPITYTPKAGFAGWDTFTYKVTDPQGASSTATVKLSITATHPRPPVADFTVSPAIGTAPVAVTFTSISQAKDGDDIANWHWGFEDGTTADYQGTVTHTYTKPGIYKVALTVTTSTGLTATATHRVLVEAPAAG